MNTIIYSITFFFFIYLFLYNIFKSYTVEGFECGFESVENNKEWDHKTCESILMEENKTLASKASKKAGVVKSLLTKVNLNIENNKKKIKKNTYNWKSLSKASNGEDDERDKNGASTNSQACDKHPEAC